MRRSGWIGIAMGLLLAAACGDDDPGEKPSIDVKASCERVADASCQKLVDCRAVIEGRAITAAVCAQIRDQVAGRCEADAANTRATQADVDACVTGFQTFLCTDLCGKVPQDPAACAVFVEATNENVITCTP